jgi:spermidine synthase
MNALGRHVLVEYFDCSPEILNDVTVIEKNMVNAAVEAGATVINSTFHHFSPFGVSGVVVIQESHLAVHTWPEYGYAAVDLFTCGDTVDPWISYRYLHRAFKAVHGSSMEMLRGQLDLLRKKADLADLPGGKDLTPEEIKYNRNIWFTERGENIARSLRHKGDRLFRKKSPYQKVEIYDTFAYGKMLTCDGMIMCAEKDEHGYHEMIVHVPMHIHPDVKKVLVIGGGDGGTVREILRHDSVEQVVMVEIDAAVVEASKEHLPSLAAALDHPKLELIIDDGIKYVRQSPDDAFDLVIIDSTDPVGPAEGLFSPAFYTDIRRILTPEGLMVAQSESPRFKEEDLQKIYQKLYKIFGKEKTHCYLAVIPTYPSGMWSFALASKGSLQPVKNFRESDAQKFTKRHPLNYYSTDIHRAAFVLPPFVQKLLK